MEIPPETATNWGVANVLGTDARSTGMYPSYPRSAGQSSTVVRITELRTKSTFVFSTSSQVLCPNSAQSSVKGSTFCMALGVWPCVEPSPILLGIANAYGRCKALDYRRRDHRYWAGSHRQLRLSRAMLAVGRLRARSVHRARAYALVELTAIEIWRYILALSTGTVVPCVQPLHTCARSEHIGTAQPVLHACQGPVNPE